MIPRQAKCTRTYTLLPYTPLFRSVLGSARRLARDQRVIDQHAEFAGEMVVADARLAQRRFARARTQTHGTDAIGDTHQAFQKLRNVALGEPEVAMTFLRFNRDEPGVEKFRQMGTRSLLGDAGAGGQPGCGECLTG